MAAISYLDLASLSPSEALYALTDQVNLALQISENYTDQAVTGGVLPPGSTVDGGTY